MSGINFPIGVLLYWLTTNVWSMGQQFYVIRRMPAPGSAAERAYEERQKKRGKTIKKLHIPGLGGLSQGPGFANLGALGLLSNRVLLPLVREKSSTQGFGSTDSLQYKPLSLKEL